MSGEDALPKSTSEDLMQRLDEAQRASLRRLWATVPPHLHDIRYDLQGPGWTPAVIDELTELLVEFKSTVSKSNTDLGYCHTLPLVIRTPEDAQTTSRRPYRTNPVLTKKVDATIDSYMAAGFIQQSTSPSSCPVAVVSKKNGEIRIV